MALDKTVRCADVEIWIRDVFSWPDHLRMWRLPGESRSSTMMAQNEFGVRASGSWVDQVMGEYPMKRAN